MITELLMRLPEFFVWAIRALLHWMFCPFRGQVIIEAPVSQYSGDFKMKCKYCGHKWYSRGDDECRNRPWY